MFWDGESDVYKRQERVLTAPELETAILVAVDTGEYDIDSSLDELEELARTAGAEVKGRLVQKRESPNAATCIGACLLYTSRCV